MTSLLRPSGALRWRGTPSGKPHPAPGCLAGRHVVVGSLRGWTATALYTRVASSVLFGSMLLFRFEVCGLVNLMVLLRYFAFLLMITQ
jgi:hypothetical protein